MARPRLPVGAHGTIRCTKRSGTRGPYWEAGCRVRDGDGVVRELRRTAPSKQAAQLALQDALDDRPGLRGDDITADSLLSDIAEKWLARCQHQVDTGALAPNSLRLYRSVWTTHSRDAVGGLTAREATTGRLDRFIVSLRQQQSGSVTKTARSVLSSILGHAVRNDALDRNPMRDVGRVSGDSAREPRSMTAVERYEWLAALRADQRAVEHDLPDLTEWMLSTGMRIGEVLALRFSDIDFADREVSVLKGITRVRGQGLVRGPLKTRSAKRIIGLTPALARMAERRLSEHGEGPLFPSERGTFRDPSNTLRAFREARKDSGFDWVTTHVFRKTVATVMDDAGVSSRVAADTLGHSKVSMTQDVYFGRRVASPAAIAALEQAEGPPKR